MEDKLYKCKTYEGYSVTEDGKVFSHKTKRGMNGAPVSRLKARIDYNHKRLLKNQKNSRGYFTVGLRINGKSMSCSVHRIVADAFYEKPFEGAIVRHLDGNPSNNHYTNLKWGTLKENSADRKIHGTHYQGYEHPNSKLTEDQAKYIKNSREKVKNLAEKFNVSISVIESIRYGKAYKNVDV